MCSFFMFKVKYQKAKGLFVIHHNVYSAPEFTHTIKFTGICYAVYGQHFESMQVGNFDEEESDAKFSADIQIIRKARNKFFAVSLSCECSFY